MTEVGTTFSYFGDKFVLGRSSDGYVIWHRHSAPSSGSPAQTFPATPEGWDQAWAVFTAWQPVHQAVTPADQAALEESIGTGAGRVAGVTRSPLAYPAGAPRGAPPDPRRGQEDILRPSSQTEIRRKPWKTPWKAVVSLSALIIVAGTIATVVVLEIGSSGDALMSQVIHAVHRSGSVSAIEQVSRAGSPVFTLQVDLGHSAARASISVAGQTSQIEMTGGTTYFNGDPAIASSNILQLRPGNSSNAQWYVMPQSVLDHSFFRSLGSIGWVATVITLLSPTKGPESTVGGARVVEINGKGRPGSGVGNATLMVTASSPHLPVLFTGDFHGGSERINFSGWGEELTVPAPPSPQPWP